MALSKRLSGITQATAEESANDMNNSTGTNYIKTGGVYKTTIERAFLVNTKKGGIQCDIHFGGENTISSRLYIVSNIKGKLVTTCKMQGKTVSLPDFKMFKQLFYVATGEVKDLGEIETKEETLKFKEYGKMVEVEAETLTELIGKEVNIAVRLEEKYNYEDGETDKTSLKVDGNGDVVYDKSLNSVYTADGLSAMEKMKKTEAKKMASDDEFLRGDKGIKRLTLEAVEIEVPEEDDEIDF